MYALMILRYRAPMEEIVAATEVHRSYLRELHAQGVVLAAGPFDPRTGGALLLRLAEDGPTLDAIRDADPFYTQGLVEYELLPWKVGIGLAALDGL